MPAVARNEPSLWKGQRWGRSYWQSLHSARSCSTIAADTASTDEPWLCLLPTNQPDPAAAESRRLEARNRNEMLMVEILTWLGLGSGIVLGAAGFIGMMKPKHEQDVTDASFALLPVVLLLAAIAFRLLEIK
jgi:hypothetical protein